MTEGFSGFKDAEKRRLDMLTKQNSKKPCSIERAILCDVVNGRFLRAINGYRQ